MKEGKYVVLCIDDDADILDVLRVILEQNDYIMVQAETAEDGLKVYDAEQPDFIFVDLMMEEVDAGRNFAKELMLRSNTAPVYILSAAGDALARNVNFEELGVNGILQKPVDAGIVLTTLKAKLK